MIFSAGTRVWAGVVAGLVILGAVAASPAWADRGFQNWVASFKGVAAKSGISSRTYDTAFAGITAPDPDVIRLTRYQPEFVQKIWQYLDTRVNDKAITNGGDKKREWSQTLNQIEKRYGVDRHILLAIWSMESSYGKALEDPSKLRNVIRSLATLAYADKRRKKFGRSQLIGALKILQRGHVSAEGLVGSWAGAMGHTQFIPTSYNLYAQDFDGNGKADIWNSIPDALATAANLLKKNGWQTGKTWGYEVNISQSLPGSNTNKTRTLGQWEKLGVRRVGGKRFPRPSDKAVLKLFSGKKGPAFLMTRNFYILKRYNNADKYALAVGLLADRLAGYPEIQGEWPRKFFPLTEEESMEVQQRLARLRLYDGEIDGKIGSGSRDAIRIMQEKFGMAPDGYASKQFLAKLRDYKG